MIAFLALGVAMTLAAVGVVVLPLFREKSGPAPVAAVLAALAIPGAVILLYAAISNYPWNARPATAERPGDAAGWAALAEGHTAAGRFAEAQDAWREAVRLTNGDNDDYRLGFAEAAILGDRSALTGEAGKIIDEILESRPANAKALWYGGMVALGRGDTAAARSRWTKLLDLGPPPEVRQIIEQELASLGGGSPAAEGTRIAVRVSVTPELASRIRPGAALFVIARAPGAAGPPLAVVRRDGARLPVELEISDANSMVPGRSMAGLAELEITARMANDGEALPATGDVFGQVLWRPGGPGPLAIPMDRVVP